MRSCKTNLISLFVGAIFLLPFLSCSQSNDASDKTPTRQLEVLGDTVDQLGAELGCMLIDRKGHFWFASNRDGIFRYDGKNTIRYTTQHGLKSNFVTQIKEDFNGHLWIATRDGYCLFDGKQFQDIQWKLDNAPNGIPFVTQSGLLFPILDAVVFYNGLAFTRFKIHPTDYQPPNNNLMRAYAVYGHTIDTKGIIWLGTQSEGVAFGNGETFFFLNDKDLGSAAVRAVFCDRDGRMWFGNNGGGLYLYEAGVLRNLTQEEKLGNDAFLRQRKAVDNAQSLARVFTINQDRDGSIWAGTIDAGAWQWKQGRLKQYNQGNGLPGKGVWYIYRDRQQRLWFMVDGQTVYLLDQGRFQRKF
ncbi:MAG TPA: two-component regulator propeller domain-containing protein [Luteibaculaceae bacterium]|nr:two-component regulator propeller domain-containing protein [Luteibaculaceae bacterium]